MAGLLVDDVISVRFTGKTFDQQFINTFHYIVTAPDPVSPGVLADLTSMSATIDGAAAGIWVRWKLCVPASSTPEFIEIQRIAPVRSVKGQRTPTAVITGRPNNNTANTSAVITKGTARGARGQVGSIHLPGVADLDQVAGELDPALLVFMDQLASAMLLPITVVATGLSMSPVLYHPPYKGDPTAVPPKPPRAYSVDPLVRAFPQTQVRVMRRRTLGVGR